MTSQTLTLRVINWQAYVFILYGGLVGPHHVASFIGFRSPSIYKYLTKSKIPCHFKFFFDVLRPEDQGRALQGCTETYNKVCQIFKEAGGAVRRESETELENSLNL